MQTYIRFNSSKQRAVGRQVLHCSAMAGRDDILEEPDGAKTDWGMMVSNRAYRRFAVVVAGDAALAA